MPNNTKFFKLLTKLKSYKFTLLILFFILLVVIFFVNINSEFKIIEGNRGCKFTGNEKLEKDIERTGKRYRDSEPNLDNSKSILNRMDITSEVTTKLDSTNI